MEELIDEISKILSTAEHEETLIVIKDFAREYIKQEESS